MVVVAEVADPDVAELDGVFVPLEQDGAFGRMILGVVGGLLMLGGALQVFGGLHDDAVEEDGDLGGSDDFAVFGDGGFEDDVVALPLTLRGGGVHEGRELAVDGTSLTVGVGDVGVAFSYLDFVFAHHEDPGVAAGLAVDFAICRDAKFEMELAVAELLFGFERPGRGDEDAILDLPFAVPSLGVGAVEEDFGVGGGFDGDEASALDFAGLGAGGVVDRILGTGDEGGVGIKLFIGGLGEKKSGGKEGENGEDCFHEVTPYQTVEPGGIFLTRSLLQNVEEDGQGMAGGAGENKEVPDGVIVWELSPGKKDDADGVGEAAGYEEP